MTTQNNIYKFTSNDHKDNINKFTSNDHKDNIYNLAIITTLNKITKIKSLRIILISLLLMTTQNNINKFTSNDYLE